MCGCERVRRCKSVPFCRHSVCAGRGLMIPRKALLEMITLIKPLLSKLPPNTPCPHPSICSLNTLNQAQVCLDAFTDASLTDNLQQTREGTRLEMFCHLSYLLCFADRSVVWGWMWMIINLAIDFLFFSLFSSLPFVYRSLSCALIHCWISQCWRSVG